MSKPIFDLNMFKTANNALSSTRSDLPPGFYICKFNGISIGQSKASGRTQATFEWQVDSQDSSEYVGIKQYEYQGLMDEKGYEIFIIKLRQLGFAQEDIEDNATSQENLVKFVNRAKGSIVKLNVTKDGEFTNLRVTKLMHNARTDDVQIDNETFNPTIPENMEETNPVATATLENKVPVVVYKQGDKVIYQNKQAEIMFCDPSANVAMIKYPDGSQEMVQYGDIVAVSVIPQENTEEIEVEVSEEEENKPQKLEVGVIAKGMFGALEIEGEVKEITNERVKIKNAKDGKIYPCKKDTVTVVAPF